jgi:hypothetical protein
VARGLSGNREDGGAERAALERELKSALAEVDVACCERDEAVSGLSCAAARCAGLEAAAGAAADEARQEAASARSSAADRLGAAERSCR